MMNCIERNFKNVKPLILYGCWIKIFIVDEKLHRNWNKLKRAWVHSSAVRCISNRFHWTWNLQLKQQHQHLLHGWCAIGFVAFVTPEGQNFTKEYPFNSYLLQAIDISMGFYRCSFLLARTFLPNWNICDYKHFFTFNFSVAQL